MPIFYSRELLKNPLGVLRQGSGRTEGIDIDDDFPFMQVLEAFRAFFRNILV
jgi:hypothetical protein